MRESEEEAALLGRIAVRYGFITMDQLAEATRERGRCGKKLGRIMLERGMINELDLGKVLALQKRQREATQHRQQATRPARPRITTPVDWAFDPNKKDESGGRGDVPHRDVPRRGRRTDDVMRSRLVPEFPPPTAPPIVDDASSSHPPPRQPTPRSLEVPEPTSSDDEPMEFELDLDHPRAPMHSGERPTPHQGLGRVPVPPLPPASKPVSARVPPPPGMVRVPPSIREMPTEPSPASEMGDVTKFVPLSAARVEPMPWDPPPAVRSVEFLHTILSYAVAADASDVHVHACTVPQMRQFGRLVPITDTPCSPTATQSALTSILTPYQRRRLEIDGEIDVAYSVEGIGRFRANIYRQQHGTNGVFHVVAGEPPTLARLGLPEGLATLTNYPQGLILLTGPAGCGKTSTMAALADIINEERADHILTIEDPIEYVFRSKRCVVNQRQVGRHTESFASGLRGALREDPDVICIGELRDLETISLALSAAETGHLVLATLHTGSAIGTINRIVGAYPAAQQSQVRAMMSESLRAVTSQRLLPTADAEGVVAALEVLFVTRPVAALIRDNRTFQIPSMMQTGRAQGMRLMDESIRDLLAARRISREVALANCEDRRKLEAV